MDQPIGYLKNGGIVLCSDCASTDRPVCGFPEPRVVKLYRINIEPYKQSCHGCDKVLVEGRTDYWCELFPKKNE